MRSLEATRGTKDVYVGGGTSTKMFGGHTKCPILRVPHSHGVGPAPGLGQEKGGGQEDKGKQEGTNWKGRDKQDQLLCFPLTSYPGVHSRWVGAVVSICPSPGSTYYWADQIQLLIKSNTQKRQEEEGL